MSTLTERLQQALDRRPDVSKADIARACKIRPPSVTAWFSGETKTLDAANLVTAANILGVDPTWLATGKGLMDAKREADDEAAARAHALTPEGRTEGDIDALRYAFQALIEIVTVRMPGTALLLKEALLADDHYRKYRQRGFVGELHKQLDRVAQREEAALSAVRRRVGRGG